MTWTRQLTSLRRLLQALLALAVLMAPVTANAMEWAAPPASSHHRSAAAHDQRAEVPAHCSSAPDSGSEHDKVPGKTCCVSMCMGVAMTPPAPLGEGAIVQAAATFPASTFLVGLPAELATPPPRLA